MSEIPNPNSKNKYIEKNGLYCSDCGEPFDYNPYNDFWFETCDCRSGNIFDVIRDIIKMNKFFNIKEWWKQYQYLRKRKKN